MLYSCALPPVIRVRVAAQLLGLGRAVVADVVSTDPVLTSCKVQSGDVCRLS